MILRYKGMGKGMEEKVFGYARVSTKEQNLDRQILALKNYGIPERDIITDKASGKNFERPGYQTLKNSLMRKGDTLVITAIDRLGRNKAEVMTELQDLKRAGIKLKCMELPTTMVNLPEQQSWIMDMISNILIEVYTSLAENERKTLLRRQREGIEAAKAKGKHLGRPRAIKPENWDEVYDLWEHGEIKAVEAMETLKITKNVFYKFAREEKEKGEADIVCRKNSNLPDRDLDG